MNTITAPNVLLILMVGLVAGCGSETTESPTVTPFAAVPFAGDLAQLLVEAEEHLGAPVRVSGDVGRIAEGGPLLTLTDDLGEVLVLIDTRLAAGQYTLDYVQGAPAEVKGTLYELTAENIDRVGDPFLDGDDVLAFWIGPRYLLVATSVVQR